MDAREAEETVRALVRALSGQHASTFVSVRLDVLRALVERPLAQVCLQFFLGSSGRDACVRCGLPRTRHAGQESTAKGEGA